MALHCSVTFYFLKLRNNMLSLIDFQEFVTNEPPCVACGGFQHIGPLFEFGGCSGASRLYNHCYEMLNTRKMEANDWRCDKCRSFPSEIAGMFVSSDESSTTVYCFELFWLV
jgi:hypothetical protein